MQLKKMSASQLLPQAHNEQCKMLAVMAEIERIESDERPSSLTQCAIRTAMAGHNSTAKALAIDKDVYRMYREKQRELEDLELQLLDFHLDSLDGEQGEQPVQNKRKK